MNQHPNFVLVIIVALITLSNACKAARAEQDEWLGEFQDWNAVAFIEDGHRNCYIVSSPKKEEGNYTQRGPVYVQVTRRHGDTTEVVSFQAGYRFKEETQINVRIEGDSYKLFTDSGMAWAWNEEGDKNLIASMRKGRKMVVVGTSWRGTETTDTYSLFGFTSAYKKLVDACG